jgi:hypothetical protein
MLVMHDQGGAILRQLSFPLTRKVQQGNEKGSKNHDFEIVFFFRGFPE